MKKLIEKNPHLWENIPEFRYHVGEVYFDHDESEGKLTDEEICSRVRNWTENGITFDMFDKPEKVLQELDMIRKDLVDYPLVFDSTTWEDKWNQEEAEKDFLDTKEEI